ncbi:MAG: hypothetical protein JWR75_1832 [Devosia sp.]|nr:hypothetical protein [Devosia sp.]
MIRTARTLFAVLFSVLFLATAVSAATVKITVNDTPITDVQISQRAALLKLEGKKGGAQEELINEALMLSEAKRIGVTVSDAQVTNALQSVARNLKLSLDKLGQVLNDSGVNVDTLKDRLRASIAWQSVVSQVVMSRVQISDLSLDQQAQGKVTAANSFDYILKEIVFIGGARTGLANSYRSKFTGCDTAVQLSMSYTDAAVIDVGRRHATQLPEAIANELAGLNVGGITKPRVIDQGVSMLAVCEKAQAEDLTFLKDSIAQSQGNAALEAEAAKYLKELRAKARIY